MKEENAKQNLNCYFTAYNRRCLVTQVTTFSGVLHYGFITVDDKDFLCGFIPVEFIGQCEYTA
jgi:hypothetical protein